MQPTAFLKDVASLLKLRLSVSIAAAAAAGFILAGGLAGPRAGMVFLCVLALASGAACLNNWQDARLDGRMQRTAGRPLPAGRVRRAQAFALAWALLIAGEAGLVLGPFAGRAAAVAALAVLLYNGIYTPLKRRTAWSLLPGVGCGSLPPLIGWLAAGGAVMSPGVWSLMMVFGLWQPPHFWLVVFAHPDDYLDGKLPSMLNVFSSAQLSRILFIWTAMLGLSMLALPLAIGMTSPLLHALELVNAVALIWVFGRRLLKEPDDRALFIVLNAGVLIGVGLVVLERLRWGV